MIIANHVPHNLSLKEISDTIVRLNEKLYRGVEAFRQALHEGPIEDRQAWAPPHEEAIRAQKYYTIQPPFRAVISVILSKNYNLHADDLSKLSFLVILTGIEDGLSAPITFDSIADEIDAHVTDKVVIASLETAYDFVAELEKREIAAYGQHPDPEESSGENMMDYGLLLERRDWECDIDKLRWGDEPLPGPSSR
ncbi:hypothetical protein PT974_01785 [Cladobotryum mycophilum]|uniref:Uncharacterized protein n=1 Tax=Cladobotryum mycophilum TaxID=491253 RepID=A0ABR0SXE7_9HYPO